MNINTTMVMVENIKTDEVLVIDRLKKYPGICFPGGHVERNESFTQCAIREIYEETGLKIKSPTLCGIVNWTKKDSDDRYVEYMFKATEFDGTLSDGTDEGRIFWVKKEELPKMKLSVNFEYYLKIFFSDRPTELFGEWTDAFDDVPKEQ